MTTRDAATNSVISLLAKLPAEYVLLIEQFARFLYEQFQRKSETPVNNSLPRFGSGKHLNIVMADDVGMW